MVMCSRRGHNLSNLTNSRFVTKKSFRASLRMILKYFVYVPPILDVCLLAPYYEHQSGDHGEVKGSQGLLTNCAH